MDNFFNYFMEIYNRGVDLKRLKPLSDENYLIYKTKNINSHPIRLVFKDKVLGFLPQNDIFLDVVSGCNTFWINPFETINGEIFAFEIRNYNRKAHYFVSKSKSSPPIYGWYDFKNYQVDEPIILCEGPKDALALKTIYPYTLALKTAGLSETHETILNKFTKNFILIYDNDQVGINATKRDVLKLKKKGIHVSSISLSRKDPAEYYTNLEFLNVLTKQINHLVGGELHV